MGQRSRVLPAEAAGMLEAARHAKRLRDPGWMGDKGKDRWPIQRLLEWAVEELTASRRGVEMELQWVAWKTGWRGSRWREGWGTLC